MRRPSYVTLYQPRRLSLPGEAPLPVRQFGCFHLMLSLVLWVGYLAFLWWIAGLLFPGT